MRAQFMVFGSSRVLAVYINQNYKACLSKPMNSAQQDEDILSEKASVTGVAEDFKFIFKGPIIPSSFNASTMVIASKIATPKSKGKLELNNTDPRKNP
ncbi:unnamed protein product [Dovyalis caffra]|uniref:Uncharacterized protein n=1 Tax=Dovyalis caffra TaxID=77055 RepID=A0AAV1R1G6_9ROSI|nr:unnamed protein product [Dovyalis caffra]